MNVSLDDRGDRDDETIGSAEVSRTRAPRAAWPWGAFRSVSRRVLLLLARLA